MLSYLMFPALGTTLCTLYSLFDLMLHLYHPESVADSDFHFLLCSEATHWRLDNFVHLHLYRSYDFNHCFDLAAIATATVVLN